MSASAIQGRPPASCSASSAHEHAAACGCGRSRRGLVDSRERIQLREEVNERGDDELLPPAVRPQPHHLRHEVQFVPSCGGDKASALVGKRTSASVKSRYSGVPAERTPTAMAATLPAQPGGGPPPYNVRTDAASNGSRTVGTRVVHDYHSKSAWIILREQAGQSRRQDVGFVARRHDRRHVWPPRGRAGVRRRRQAHRGAPEPAVAEREVDPRGER